MLSVIHYYQVAPYVDGLAPQTTDKWMPQALASDKLVEAFPVLRDWRISERLKSHGRLVENGRTLPAHDDLTPFQNTSISTLGLKARQSHDIVLHELTDVYLTSTGKGFVLFDRDGLSARTTALPNFPPDVRDAIKIGEGFFTVDRFSGNNIGHFTFDHVGKAILAQEICGFPEQRICFINGGEPYTWYVRSKVMPGARILERGILYQFSRLYLFQESFWCTSQPANFCDVRVIRRLQAALRLPESGRNKIYLPRRDVAARRPPTNQEALESRLSGLGVQSVHMSDLTPQEQFAVVAGAKVIIGPHGSAFTSLIGCAPKTRVIEIFNPSVGTLAFYQIAKAVGLDYHFLIGDPTDQDGSWTVDIERVVSLL